MTATELSRLRVVAFGDPAAGIWAAVIDAGEPAIVFATPEGTGSASGPDAVRLTDEGHSWRLAGEGFELLITPAREAGGARDGEPAEGDSSGPGDSLCQVQGTLSVAGAERAVNCVGTRTSTDGLDLVRLDSLRVLSGWFDSDRGLVLLSFRPVGSAAQERDLLTATVFEPEGPILVAEPRLSTTYSSHDTPSRASLELWIGDGEEQYPRRAAAEALGAEVGVDGDRMRLRATPLRCHTAGLDGAGVYLLARF
ncbi:MAG: hypothetical protein ACR2MK_11775 [Solirubrobacteraceae bacterium]